MGRHALVTQPTPMPTRKVAAVGGTAGAVTLLVWAAHRLLGVELDPELAALIVAAVASLAGYVVRERRDRGDALAETRHRYRDLGGPPPAPRTPPDDAGAVDPAGVLYLVIQILLVVFLIVAILVLVKHL